MTLLSVLRMVLFYPLLDQRAKLICPFNQFNRLAIGYQAGVIVVYLVAFLSTGVEVVDERLVGRAENKSNCLKRRCMLTAFGRGNAIAFAGEHHLRQLLHGIVRHRKPPVRRQSPDRRVLEVTVDDGSQLVQLAAARLVPVQSP